LLSEGWFWGVVALSTVWLLFFNELRSEWDINAQYNFGYCVPLLGAFLVWRRWADRPAAAAGHSAVAACLAAALLFVLLPLRVISEANPEWRLVYWVHGAVVATLTFCLLYRLGGVGWVRWFAPAVLFMLIAVPWPMGLEQSVIQNLARLVAGLTVETAGWFGIPALQHGNLIEVGSGVVGIDEACSGVRSLQSALMLSLFLGEMNRFSAWRRAALLAGSAAFVILANLCRTTFLTYVAATSGLRRMESWHDTAGVLVMLIVLPGLLGLAHLMRPAAATTAPSLPAPVPPGRAATGTIPRWLSAAVLAWLVIAAIATEAWYRFHESDVVPTAHWTVNWPASSPQFKKTSVPPNSLAILRCSQSDAAAWVDDEGREWSGFFLRWNPGKNSAQLAKGHRPDICFPAAGAQLQHDFGMVTMTVGGVSLPFRHESFTSGSRLLQVFYCLWPDRRARREKVLLEDGSEASRWQAVMAGKRHLGQQVLEIVVVDSESNDGELALMRQKLPSLIRISQTN
jgi:exosortase